MLPALDLDMTIRLSRHAALKTRSSQEILVLPERAMRLSGSSAEILRLCEGPRTGQEILTIMRSRYGDDRQIDDEVTTFLAEMLGRGALEATPSECSHRSAFAAKPSGSQT